METLHRTRSEPYAWQQPESFKRFFTLEAGDAQHERKALPPFVTYRFEPFTRRLFEASGVREGMKVLDVGSGEGDVAFLAAQMVGPRGRVVGIDSNPVVLETARLHAAEAGLCNVSCWQWIEKLLSNKYA